MAGPTPSKGRVKPGGPARRDERHERRLREQGLAEEGQPSVSDEPELPVNHEQAM